MKVLLLLLLGCSLAQGHPVDKCSLRAKIKEATKGMDKGLDGENFRAKSKWTSSFSLEEPELNVLLLLKSE